MDRISLQVGSSSANATANFGAGFAEYGGFGGGGGSPPRIGSEAFSRRTSRRHQSMPGNGDGLPPRTAGGQRDRSPGAAVGMDRERDRERDRGYRDRSPGGGGLGGFDRDRDRGFGSMGSMGMGMGTGMGGGMGMGMGMSGGGITGRLNLGLGAGLVGIMGGFGGRRMRDPLPPPWAINDHDY